MAKIRYYITALLPFGEGGPITWQRYTKSGIYGTETFTLAYPYEFGGPTLFDSEDQARAEFPRIAEKFNINPESLELRELKRLE